MSDDFKQPSEEQQPPSESRSESADRAAGPPDSEATDGRTADATTQADLPRPETELTDELPEIEPLTPELVEEEAIRGDFMLRWAAIFLALLFGFSKMTETRTLVHVRSGEQMRADGFLPPATDTLSFAAEGRPAVNVSWLFDHVLSGIWAAGGDAGLSVFKACMAAITAWILSRISVPGLPTWWSSICAVLAIVACSGDFAATTDLMTLLGMVLLLALLHQHREGRVRGLVWKLPLLIAVWCNLDPRAWIGALAVIMYAGGMMLAFRRSKSRGVSEGRNVDDVVPETQGLYLASVLGVAALLVNPFPLNSLLSAAAIYSVEYPTLHEQRPLASAVAGASFDGRVDYVSMLDPDAVTLFDHTQIAGLQILVIAIVALALSRSAADRGWMAMLAGLTLLAVYRAHELPVAALSAAVIAATLGQRWYRRHFNQQYSIEPRELMFSRGGRAVTVFAFAFLGFCVVAGRLPGNTPTGVGYERDTQTTIETLGRQLETIPQDAHILHTRLHQGDILIWHGRQSMIDSRVMPFGRIDNPDSIAAKHRLMLRNLLLPQQTAVEDEEKQQQAKDQAAAVDYLQEFAISHIMPRLSPPGPPDYRSILTLATRPDWLLVQMGPSAAFLEKVDPGVSDEERGKKQPEFDVRAFQDVDTAPLVRVDFAREPDFYQRYVYRRRPAQDQHVRQAGHYLWLAAGQMQTIDQVIASLSLTTLAIRELNTSLYHDPQSGQAYRFLGLAYRQLGMIESMLAGQPGESTQQEMRYLQSVIALRQALKTTPDDLIIWEILYQQFSSRQKQDLASECLGKWLALQDTQTEDIEVEATIKEMFEVQRQLSESIRDSQARLDEFLQTNPLSEDAEEKGSQVIALATELAQTGFSLQALALLEQHTDVIRTNPFGQTLMGTLLLERGSIEEGFRILNQLAMVAREQPEAFTGVRWHFPAAVSQLAVADYVSAVDYLTLQLKEIDQAAATPEPQRNMLLSAPLAAEYALLPQALLSHWPVGHLNAVALPITGIARARADVRFLIALCQIEAGNVQSAKLVLQALIAESGDTPYRQLGSYYLTLLDTNSRQFIDEHTLNNWEDFQFVTAAADASDDPVEPRTANGSVKDQSSASAETQSQSDAATSDAAPSDAAPSEKEDATEKAEPQAETNTDDPGNND